MHRKLFAGNGMLRHSCFLFSVLLGLQSIATAWAEEGEEHHSLRNASFTTLVTTPLVIEGLAGDRDGNLYSTGRTPGAGLACPVYRTSISRPGVSIVGYVPAYSATVQCSPSGLAFDAGGKLYICDNDRIYVLTPDAATPPLATTYASGVPGSNGLAFDRAGNIWTGDGTTGQGRVWKIAPGGVVTEAFRVQPMANEVNLVAGVGGVGRDIRGLPAGKITVTATTRNAFDTGGSQPLVANGVAFNREGDMFIADTARGALWKVQFDRQGNIRSRMGCDTTFTANTLCMSNIFVAHPLLEGADGIALDVAGNIWVAGNERNAMVFVEQGSRRVTEVFRNAPDNISKLRNLGPLEFPTSPFLVGNKLCTANSDGNRRDNSPNTAGEIGGAGQPKGKISCLDQWLPIPGLRLPL